MINGNNNSACLTTLPQFSQQTVAIRSCSGINQCISDAPRPALILSWGSRAPFLGKDLVVPEIQRKRTFLPQWCHSVAETGNAQDRGLLPSRCLAGERLLEGLPGLPEALRSTSCPPPVPWLVSELRCYLWSPRFSWLRGAGPCPPLRSPQNHPSPFLDVAFLLLQRMKRWVQRMGLQTFRKFLCCPQMSEG